MVDNCGSHESASSKVAAERYGAIESLCQGIVAPVIVLSRSLRGALWVIGLGVSGFIVGSCLGGGLVRLGRPLRSMLGFPAGAVVSQK